MSDPRRHPAEAASLIEACARTGYERAMLRVPGVRPRDTRRMWFESNEEIREGWRQVTTAILSRYARALEKKP